MQYLLLAGLIVLAVMFFYRIVMPLNEPDFLLKGTMTHVSLGHEVSSLANASKNIKPRGKGLSLRLIKKNIVKAYKVISKKANSNLECFDFEHWIYDNYYKLSELLYKQKKNFYAYFKLPHCNDVPRIYTLAESIVKHSEGCVLPENLKELIEIYNEETPLQYEEVINLRNIIEYVLLEYIAIFCSKSILINSLIDRAGKDTKNKKIDLARLRFNSYVYGIYQLSNGDFKKIFNGLCLDNGIDLFSRVDNFNRQLARYNGQTQSAITSVQKLSLWFTDKYILQLSPIYSFLSQESDIVFNEVTIATKNLYLHRISSIAKRKKCNELLVAREVSDKAKNDKKDIAHYILNKAASPIFMRLYIFVNLVAALIFGVIFFMFLNKFAWLIVLLSAPILISFSILICSQMINHRSKRRYLPRYDLKFTDEQNAKTMIVCSRLIGSTAELDDAFDNLLTIHYANSSDIFSYGLLIDLMASDIDGYTESDISLINYAKELYEKLPYKERFNLFIRKRKLILNEKKYQGWERKRGALINLNDLILQDKSEDFYCVLGESYKVKYVIALDSDTLVNSCYGLVELIMHPYNIDKNVMSINMTTNPESAEASRFATLMCGGMGLDNYSNFSADANNDLFSSGNYTGKGIYRVAEFNEKVKNAFMENRIISHDFIEGAISGCINSNEKAVDNFPLDYSQYIKRQLRWLRGDWQLLPYMLKSIKNAKGEKVKNPISVIAKWHIFSNVVFSLCPISSILILLLSVFTSFLPIIIVAFIIPLYFILNSVRHSILYNPREALNEFNRQVFYISCLPVLAVNHVVAITATLIRLITKKNLLQWNVFAHSKGKISFLPNIIFSIIFIIAGFFSYKVIYLFVALVFLLGIFIDIFLSGAVNQKNYIDKTFDTKLENIAKNTWSYFKEQLTEKNNYLPCDNFQEYMGKGWCFRTSPTNIGMALVSIVCAYEFDFISCEEKNQILDKIISSIEQLEKWKGHVYNWIDIRSLEVLNPKYISTVDSGNLLASMTLIKSYTRGTLCERLENLIQNTDMAALYDEERGLLRIGYNETNMEYDSNHYDLLGSESSLTYLLACGSGKIKVDAWKNLSRECVKVEGTALYSWTGGMFEYLLSGLFFDFSNKTLIKKSNTNVVKTQIEYAKQKKYKCWGISESQYNYVDSDGFYQYKAFGIQGLAHSNILDCSVVAPYASILALKYAPKAVKENIENFEKLNMLGKWGFYEGIDMADSCKIQTYMSHHQGMLFAAITNYLKRNALTNSMKKQPEVRAAKLLLTQDCNCMVGAKRKVKQNKAISSLRYRENIIKQYKLLPQLNLLSNGKYNIVVDESARGYSIYDGILLSRFDGNRFDGGMKVEAQIDNGRYNLCEGMDCIQEVNRCKYSCRNHQFRSEVELMVLPENSGEVRVVNFKNLTNRVLEVNFSTYMELVLTNMSDDIAHRAYSNMFINTELDANYNMIVAYRTNKDKPLYLSHFIAAKENVKYETNRINFYNRGKLDSFGQILDPIVSGGFNVKINPRQNYSFSVFTLVAYNQNYLKRVSQLATGVGFVERIKGSSFSLSRYNYVRDTTKQIASQLLYNCSERIVKHDFFASQLNYNLPTICLQVKNSNSLSKFRQQLIELSKLYKFGISFNLTVLYSEKHNYYKKMLDLINGVLDETNYRRQINRLSTINLYNICAIENAIIKNLLAASVDINFIDNFALTEVNSEDTSPYPNAVTEPYKIEYQLGFGGYNKDGYVMDLSREDTPAPWSNIIADGEFGTLITESGGGYTYQGNSRENKLTKWSNDAVIDPPSESVILGEKGLVWSITKKPIVTESNYYVCHALGYSEFKNNFNGIEAIEKQYLALNHETKLYEIILTNHEKTDREIDIMFCADVVLGDFRINTLPAMDCYRKDNKLIAENTVKGTKLYINSSEKLSSYAYNRESFCDRNGNIIKNSSLSNQGITKCLAYSVKIKLPNNGTKKIIFSLSAEENFITDINNKYFEESVNYFSNLSSIKIESGNKSLDYLAKWLPYQVLTARFNGRTGFYQAGGAIGFRDQLQDCMTLLYIDTLKVKNHIIDCAKHQFEDGDVQHWWHKPNIGVRTHICDDRLFLPLLTAEYIDFTQDFEILAERCEYLENVTIGENQASVYNAPNFTERKGSLLEHCLRAIDVSCDFGENGLMRMRGGDWNDAMDEVGHKGIGTSVWCSMFLYYCIKRFLPHINDFDKKNHYLETANKLAEAVANAWDGEWFIRAYTDEGKPIGSIVSKECKIDLLTQSWSQISGIAGKDRVKLALNSADNRLVDRKNGIIKLLDPPFKLMENIGYIADYPIGVRENGGQYTHAAIWYIISLLEFGDYERGFELLDMINPINHAKSMQDVEKYRVEPYVIAADVYAADKIGRGGWTWYTGAASWYYKCIVETLLGISIKGKVLTIAPKLSKTLNKIKVMYKSEVGEIEILIDNSGKESDEWKINVNTISYNTNSIVLTKSLLGKVISVIRRK